MIDVVQPANAGAGEMIATLRDGLIAEHLGVEHKVVAERIATSAGSIIEAIESLRGHGKTLRPYQTPDLSGVEAWLADNEVLDPEGPGEMFESTTNRGLFRSLWHRAAG